MGQTVNLLVFTFGGSNPSPPTHKGMNATIALRFETKRNDLWNMRK